MISNIEQRKMDNPLRSNRTPTPTTHNFAQVISRLNLINSKLFSLILLLSSLLLGANASVIAAEGEIVQEPIKVGVLYSLTGTMAISEASLVDAIQLAIKEINEDGGILGRPLKAVIEDGQSDWPTFAEKAEKLITIDRVSSIFGCWTSASRKAVLPIVERNDHLLWYVVQYEGQEASRNVIYGGAAPNQQIIPALDWLVIKLNRRRPFLVGSDYIFPRVANSTIKNYLAIKGIKVADEIYHNLGDQDFSQTVNKIKSSKADCVLNTLNGDSNVGFFAALAQTGLDPNAVPVMSFSIAEHEIRGIGTQFTAGHYAAWNYFQSVESEANRLFVQTFKNAFGLDRVTDDPIEAAYSQVYLFSRAVARAGSSDPREIRAAAMGLELETPGGVIRIDPSTQHTWKIARVGKIRSDGQFQIIWSSPRPIKPEPFGFQSTVFRQSEPMSGDLGFDRQQPLSLDALRVCLFDQDWSIRLQASQRMAQIGVAAIPILEDCLGSADHMVRSSALRALGQMGATARNAIPQIMPLLQDSNVIVQEQALRYLIQTSDPSIAFFPTILTLLGDSDPIVRRLAVNALCKLTPKSPESLPNLARSLDFVYSSAVVRITDLVVEIVSVAEDKLDSSCIGPLSDIVRKHGKNISTAQLNIIKNSILHIQYRSSNTFFEWLIRGLFGSPWVLVPTVYLFFIVFVWQVALRVCPLLILRINFALQPYDARLPEHLGGFQLPLRWLLVVGMFQYHIRVLDAWVKTHLHEARTNFENKDTVAQRKVYVASPVELGGTAYPYVTPDILRPEISSPRWCILIYGEGGIGKTALACEIARWGMSEIPTSKLCAAHPMLPVLLEPGVVPEKLDHTDAFLNSISGHLRALIGATEELNIEFVRHLLIHGRVIVIADDVVVNPASPDFPAAALLVTSREKCVLGDVPKTCILPQQIHAEYLSNFLNAYLTVKGERPSFTDTNFFGACQRLSAIVRDRSITALLAKMYAELLIASKSYGTPLAFKDIPELMLGYLAELNRRKDETWLSDEEVCTYLQKIARASLNQDYRLTSFDRARLITESETYDMISIFDYLEKRLHVIRSLGFSRSRYSFTIEPLGEYLAAMDIVRDVSNDSSRWDQIIHRISNQSDNSFAHALWDCVLSKGRSTDCPGWVAARLSELIPKDVVVVSPECIKIGVIHSLSGTMSISERSLVDAVQLAVDEINLQGGLLGRRLVTMVEDGASEPATFARKAERLILEEKVCALFGCWTSASRKAVLSVVEENDHLLFYPLQYEGFESSKNIIYTGASPNQQIIPAVQWCMKELKRTRPFLIGSDYVFPRTANKIIRALLPEFGGVCAGEVYRRLGDRCFEDVVQQLHDSGADVIFNTINGDSNIGFFQAMKAAAVRPDTIPVISFSFAEEELRAIGTELMAGHYCAWNYFQSVDSEENRMFVAAFKGKYGQERVTDDPIEAAYFGVHVFALAVMKAQSADPRAIREACRGLTFLAPRGQITIDPINQHTWAIARVGRIRKDGQFEIVWNSPEIIPPNPYPIEIDKL